MNTTLGLWQSLKRGRQHYGLSSANGNRVKKRVFSKYMKADRNITTAFASPGLLSWHGSKSWSHSKPSCCLLELDVYGHGSLACWALIADGPKFRQQTPVAARRASTTCTSQFLRSTLVRDSGHDLRTQPGHGGLVLGFDLPFHVCCLWY
jgi:hypothetical protein